jgi:Nif-specific regulatory protein
VARKTFREDLFYRLQVLLLRVPSLAERRDDLAALASYFCEQACDTHHLSRLQLSSSAVRAVENAEWGGNVRQLAHAIQGAAILAAAENALFIEPQHIFPDAKEGGRTGDERLTFQAATRQFQSELLDKTLRGKGWNITETAVALDLTRSHVYNLIHAFGLEKKKT